MIRAALLLALTLGCSRARTPAAAPWALPTLPPVAGAYSVRSDLVWSPRESLGVGPDALAWANREDETLVALRAVDGHDRETLFLLHIDGAGRTTTASAPTETDMRLLDVVATEDAFLVLVGDHLYRVHLDGRLRLERFYPERARAGNPMPCGLGDRGGLGPRARASSSTRAQTELRQQPRPSVILEGPGGGWLLPVVDVPPDACHHAGLCLNVLSAEGGTAGQWCDLDARPADERQRHGGADARWFLCGPHANDVRAFYEGLGAAPVDWAGYCADVAIQDPYVLPTTAPDAFPEATWTVVESFIRRHVHDPWNNLGAPQADVLTTASGTWVTWTEWLPEDRVVLRTARVASTGLPEPPLEDLPIAHPFAGGLDAYDTRHGLLVVADNESGDTTAFWPEAGVSQGIPAVRVTIDEEGTAWVCTRVPPARCGTLTPGAAELRPAPHVGWPMPSRDALSVLVELGTPVHSVALVDAHSGAERIAPRASHSVQTVARHDGFGWYTDGDQLWRVSDDAIEAVEPLGTATWVLRADTLGLRAVSRDALLADLRPESEAHFAASFAGEGWATDGPTSSMFWPHFGVVEQSLTGDLVSVRFTPSMRVARHMSVLSP